MAVRRRRDRRLPAARTARRDDGRWLRAWQGGRAKQPAFAADYAWLVDAFTRLGEPTGEARWIGEARAAADALLDLFWDDERGGLFTTGSDGERLIVRSKDLFDGATPSANSVAAVALVRLGALTGDERYTDAARGDPRACCTSRWPTIRPPSPTRWPPSTCSFPASTRSPSSATAPTWSRRCSAAYRPNAVLAWGEPYESPLWEGRRDGHAYVCRHYTCQAPVSTVEELLAQL